MSKHDYSMQTVQNISNMFESMRSYINGVTLSSESITDWDSSLVGDEVSSIDVQQLADIKTSFLEAVNTGDTHYSTAVKSVGDADTRASETLGSSAERIEQAVSRIEKLTSWMKTGEESE